jgi:hypothetical protein
MSKTTLFHNYRFFLVNDRIRQIRFDEETGVEGVNMIGPLPIRHKIKKKGMSDYDIDTAILKGYTLGDILFLLKSGYSKHEICTLKEL